MGMYKIKTNILWFFILRNYTRYSYCTVLYCTVIQQNCRFYTNDQIHCLWEMYLPNRLFIYNQGYSKENNNFFNIFMYEIPTRTINMSNDTQLEKPILNIVHCTYLIYSINPRKPKHRNIWRMCVSLWQILYLVIHI